MFPPDYYNNVYTAMEKFGISTIFNKCLMLIKAALVDQKYRENFNIVQYYCNLKYWFSILI